MVEKTVVKSKSRDLALPLQDVNILRELLERQKGELMKALVAKLDPDQFIRVALTTVQRRPELLACDARSFLCGIMESAQMGLLPDNAWGTYLVPFKDKSGRPHVQLIISYRGLLKLVRRSGEIARISAEVVRDCDIFQVKKGSRPDIHHEPSELEGPLTHAYAVATLYDRTGIPLSDLPQFEVMTRNQIDAIRARSKAAHAGPWVTDYDDMARKTVLRKLCKYLPVDPIVEKALQFEDRHYSEGEQTATVLPSLKSFFSGKGKKSKEPEPTAPAPEEDAEAEYEVEVEVVPAQEDARDPPMTPEEDFPEPGSFEPEEEEEEKKEKIEPPAPPESADDRGNPDTGSSSPPRKRGRPPLPRDADGKIIGSTSKRAFPKKPQSSRDELIDKICNLVQSLTERGYPSKVPVDVEQWSVDNLHALVRTLTIRYEALEKTRS